MHRARSTTAVHGCVWLSEKCDPTAVPLRSRRMAGDPANVESTILLDVTGFGLVIAHSQGSAHEPDNAVPK